MFLELEWCVVLLEFVLASATEECFIIAGEWSSDIFEISCLS